MTQLCNEHDRPNLERRTFARSATDPTLIQLRCTGHRNGTAAAMIYSIAWQAGPSAQIELFSADAKAETDLFRFVSNTAPRCARPSARR